MHRRNLLHFLLAGMVSPWALAVPGANTLLSARAWDSGDKLRLVFDLSGPTQYQTFSLEAPRRLVIDLDHTRVATDLSDLPPNNRLVSAVRSGARGDGARIVLDLQAPAQLQSFILEASGGNRHRLVLDLYSSTASPPPATLARSETPRVDKAQRDIIVMVDAGHGGKDPGALGPKGEKEKIIALAIAQELARNINRQRGFKAYLVRNQDVFVPLRKRVEAARKRNADMFVSVHADAAPRRSASGASVFALSQNGATSTTARWMAERENSADLIGAKELLSLKDKDPVLAGVILDMSLTSTISTSLDLGKAVLDRVGKVAGIHQKRVEQAGFAVLKSPDIPSILVETGFISNSQDCRRLSDPRHQKRVADAIFRGVQQHFSASPPLGTYIAAQQSRVTG